MLKYLIVLSSIFISILSSCNSGSRDAIKSDYKSYLSKVDSCSECGSKDLTIAVVASSGGIYQPGAVGVSFKCSRISVICTRCGFINKEFAEEPETLN